MPNKLYVAMVGLPARGKSTLARRIQRGLQASGAQARIFNNGDIRRHELGKQTADAKFYDPENIDGRSKREHFCLQNMEMARAWLADEGDVAILDATNASRARRALIEKTLQDHPVLFIECVNEDPLLLSTSIRRKADLPEFAGYSEDEAVECFMQRIRYYEEIYTPVREEQYWMCVDAMANRILEEHALESSPFYSAIREIVVSVWTPDLYLARHGQTEFNVQGRIGGDPPLTAKGRAQAQALAAYLRGKPLSWVFTSTRLRSHETAAPVLQNRRDCHVMALKEFDEIWAGDCEGMRYEDIHIKMPEVTAGRNADKYKYAYPNGESYAILAERVRRGLRRALFLAGDSPLLIVGHQAINRVILSLFLRQRTEDVPYIHIPQNECYHISLTPTRKVFERIPYK